MPIVVPPVVFCQIHARGGSFGDCGPCAALTLLNVISGGRFPKTSNKSTEGRFGTRDQRIALVVAQRRKSGTLNQVSTSVGENFTGLGKWAAEFALLGLQAPKVTHRNRVNFDSTFVPLLQAGKAAMVAIRYADYDAHGNHKYSGQCGFATGHMICTIGHFLVGGVAHTTVLDPIADGRCSSSCAEFQDCANRSAGIVAKGPFAVPLSLIKNAAGDYAGAGRIDCVTAPAVSLITAPADPPPDTPEPPVDPDPPDPPDPSPPAGGDPFPFDPCADPGPSEE
jgi:hypothetical protein